MILVLAYNFNTESGMEPSEMKPWYEFILSIHASLLCPTILQYSALSGVNYLDLSLHWSSIFLDQLFYSEKIEDMKYMFEEERRLGGK